MRPATPLGDGHEAIANALVVQPDGKLLLAGSARDGGATKLAVARFSAEGAPDPSFGSGGSVLLPAGDGDDVAATAAALQLDGKVLLAGHASDADGSDLLLVRLNADGTLDDSFGSGGVALTPLGDDGLAEANGLVLRGERAIVTGFASQAGELQLMLASYLLSDAPGGGGGGGTSGDTTRPVIGRARMTPAAFRVGPGRGIFAARARARRRRAPAGTTIRYSLSEAARVTLSIQRKARGVKVRGRCLRPSHRRQGGRCTRLVAVGRPLVRESPSGATAMRWNGRIGRKALAPGRYRLTIGAVDAAGNRSRPRTLSFRVLR